MSSASRPTGEGAPLLGGDDRQGAAASAAGGASAATPALPRVWSDRPEAVTCPGCAATVTSRVAVNECTWQNWLLVGVVGLFCVFLPNMFDCASRAVHRCPNCGFALGEGYGQFWRGKD